jgi:hypothetical protein
LHLSKCGGHLIGIADSDPHIAFDPAQYFRSSLNDNGVALRPGNGRGDNGMGAEGSMNGTPNEAARAPAW